MALRLSRQLASRLTLSEFSHIIGLRATPARIVGVMLLCVHLLDCRSTRVLARSLTSYRLFWCHTYVPCSSEIFALYLHAQFSESSLITFNCFSPVFCLGSRHTFFGRSKVLRKPKSQYHLDHSTLQHYVSNP